MDFAEAIMKDFVQTPTDSTIELEVGKWKDKNGNVWNIEDMDNSYLYHVVNFLENSNFSNKAEHIDYMKQVLNERLETKYGFID